MDVEINSFMLLCCYWFFTYFDQLKYYFMPTYYYDYKVLKGKKSL